MAVSLAKPSSPQRPHDLGTAAQSELRGHTVPGHTVPVFICSLRGSSTVRVNQCLPHLSVVFHLRDLAAAIVDSPSEGPL